MSHVIRHDVLPLKVDKRLYLSDISEEVFHEDRAEGGSYHGSFQWVDSIEPFACEDDARAYLVKHFQGYNDGAVRFYDVNDLIDSKRVIQLKENLTALENRLKKFERDHNPRNRKSDSVTCQKCRSRISLFYYRGDHSCPVCGGELYAQSTVSKIASYKARIKETEGKISEERKKRAKKAPIKWLAKYEYHV